MKRLLTILFTIISINAIGGEVIYSQGSKPWRIRETDIVHHEKIVLSAGAIVINEGTLYVKEIVMSPESILINEGTLYVKEIGSMIGSRLTNNGSLIFDGNFYVPLGDSDTFIVNEGYIECNNLKFDGSVQFTQNGTLLCNQSFDYSAPPVKVNVYDGVILFGENSSTIVSKNVNIQSSYTVKLLGSLSCENISISYFRNSYVGDGHVQFVLGDIKCKSLTIAGASLELNGMSSIGHILGNEDVHVNKFLVVGWDIDDNSHIYVHPSGKISLCYNPTGEKDYSVTIYDGGIIFYRIKYDNEDSHFWTWVKIHEEEKDDTISGIYPNDVSYDECVDGKVKYDISKTIVHGVINSKYTIVIFNQVGQIVATAFQRFAISSLGVGVYFAKTIEGCFSFIVR